MRSVFIVDDNAHVIDGLVEHVPWDTLHTFVKASAVTGEEAFEQMKQDPPDILITDIYMPGMDGLQLIKNIRSAFPDIYIVIHSGFDHFENARQAMKYGVQHFLLKPSTVEEISTVVREITEDIEVHETQHALMKHYKEHVAEYHEQMRQSLFREMLAKQMKSADVPAEKLDLLHLQKNLTNVVLSISFIRPPYLKKSKEKEWQLKKFGSENIIKETITKEAGANDIDTQIIDYSDSMFVIIFLTKADPPAFPDLCKDISEAILKNILIFMKISAVAGISKERPDLFQITESFWESQKVLEIGEYREINKVYSPQDYSEEQPGEEIRYPIELVKDVQDAVHQKEYNNIFDVWHRLEHDIAMEQRYPFILIQNLCLSIISTIILQENKNRENESSSQIMAHYIEDMYAKSSPEEIVEWLEDIISEWSRSTKAELNSKKSHKLIEAVKEHIDQYYDQELTLSDIAGSLYVNRNYLSQLFNKGTGKTFGTYLNEHRIEKAKDILKENQYMIYEVSEMVGYQNPTYFSQVFKSITGVSPSSFYK
ncbi:response regulator transcription factor [Salibacterium aidingense]|uniref:response regulator transcription factor n=1 Tax=Salibacterium aidingense TaxID=384933 RepID=UPI0003F55379|nr:response regulator [Salibacterium aidingense]